MKRFLYQIAIYLLYLTPVGYILSLFKLTIGESTPGVYVDLSRDRPINVHVKQNPLIGDRFHWIFNGASLLSQAYVIVDRKVGGDWGASYSWIAIVFGVVNITAALNPKIDWTKKLPRFLLWFIVISSLIFTVAFYDVYHYFSK